MKIIFRYIVLLLVIAALTSIIYGLNIEEKDPVTAQKFIGGGTAGLFLVAMPLFLFTESRGKNMKDYMLTNENIKKMQNNERKNTDTQ
ncbi:MULTISPECIES: hypothetical protein [Flagellimonas]|uniref:Isoleucyl-tRNA synthetase n=2 Tax=Flagellimonas TaxID=444459 RepID=A0A3A1NPB8_9FLAO|nr:MULTISPECIES: hypothetical protein [Allomuricauda]RIV46261.1 hypothetical protein D2V05_04295 [Allomuricauda maritima]RIV73296.1 hypothetical protein D2U88_03955 [Allomuricauda aequoris]TXJ98961.1 hypothetical protein FQ017_04265 [Allomuricauda maritima]TXK07109.1 hypothetical protein FQ019_03930 [Allomuricauda aequoris]